MTINEMNNILNNYVSKHMPGDYMLDMTRRTIRGLSSTGYGGVPTSKDKMGHIFFTRPQLNLRDNNLANIRMMSNFLNKDSNSIQNYVRHVLDPRLYSIYNMRSLMDPYNPFIPIFTNACKSLSGWPSYTTKIVTTTAGIKGQQWGMVDGSYEELGSFDLSGTFSNSKEEPIMLILLAWVVYMSSVFEGVMSPYNDMVVENELDYNLRIWRIVTDETDTFVTKLAHTGASIPMNFGIGKFFDYDVNNVYNMTTKDINISFKSFGVSYMDPISVKEFNQHTYMFNPEMRRLLLGKSNNMVKIPSNMRNMFEYYMYPIINLRTSELEWYTYKSLVKQRLNLGK